MKIIDPKSAINRRQDEGLMIENTAIYRVSYLNRTALIRISQKEKRTLFPNKKS